MEYSSYMIAVTAFAPYLGAFESDKNGPEYMAVTALVEWLKTGEVEDLRTAVRSAVMIPCGELPPAPLNIAGNALRQILDNAEIAEEVRRRGDVFVATAKRLEPAMIAAQERGELANKLRANISPIDQYPQYRRFMEEAERQTEHRRKCEDMGEQALEHWAHEDPKRKSILASLKKLYLTALASGADPSKVLLDKGYQGFLPPALIEVVAKHAPIPKILSRTSKVWPRLEQNQLDSMRRQMQQSDGFKTWSGQPQRKDGRPMLSEETWSAIGQALEAANAEVMEQAPPAPAGTGEPAGAAVDETDGPQPV